MKAATGCAAVNILQNNGAEAGQEVNHCHFHVLPRTADDGLLKLPASAKVLHPATPATPGQASTRTQAMSHQQSQVKVALHTMHHIYTRAGWLLRVGAGDAVARRRNCTDREDDRRAGAGASGRRYRRGRGLLA